MVEVTDKATGAKVLEQVFDAEGRIVEVKSGRLRRTRRIFDGLRAMETITGPQSRRQDVYGVGLDRGLVVRSDAGTTLFGHPDDTNRPSMRDRPQRAGGRKLLLLGIRQNPGSSILLVSPSPPAVPRSNPHSPAGPTSARSSSTSSVKDVRPDARRVPSAEDVYGSWNRQNRYLYCKHNPVSFTNPARSIIPLLIAIGIVSAEGGLTALGTAVVSGAVIGGVTGIGVNAARQNVQIQAHEGRTEFSFTKMFVSGGVGIVAGAGFPLLL